MEDLESKFYRAQMYIEGERERVENVFNLSTALAKESSNHLSLLSLYERGIAGKQDVFADCQEKISKYAAESFGLTDTIIEQLTARNKNFDIVFDFPRDIDSVYFDTCIYPVFGIKSMYLSGKIFVWLPRLPAKIRRASAKSKFKTPYLYGRCYADEVRHCVGLVANALTDEQDRSFTEKTVNYYFVYPRSATQCNDSDNHDTKMITDAITGLLPHGDEAEFCSFFYQTAFTDEIKSGTYAVVIPGQSPTVFNTIFPEIKIFEGTKIL